MRGENIRLLQTMWKECPMEHPESGLDCLNGQSAGNEHAEQFLKGSEQKGGKLYPFYSPIHLVPFGVFHHIGCLE
jgi:hypothetical protein